MDVLLITKPSKRRDQKNVDYKCQLKMKNKTKTEDGDRGRREREESIKKGPIPSLPEVLERLTGREQSIERGESFSLQYFSAQPKLNIVCFNLLTSLQPPNYPEVFVLLPLSHRFLQQSVIK
jgi:hypothetical protein